MYIIIIIIIIIIANVSNIYIYIYISGDVGCNREISAPCTQDFGIFSIRVNLPSFIRTLFQVKTF